MLDAAITEQLRGHLEKLVHPIELVASLDDRPKASDLWTLLEEIAALSPLVTAARADDPDDIADGRRPAFAIRRSGTSVAVTFAGIPMGHELTSLLLALLHVGGHPPAISEETRARIESLAVPPGGLRFETYYSLTCQNCPDVVQGLNILSVLRPDAVQHVAIDGALNQAEVDDRGVMGVPSVFVNGEHLANGRMTLDELLDRLDTGAEEATAAAIDAADPYEVLIVGGGPAGAAAAVYAARKGIRTGMVVERLGGQVLDTMAIENFVSVEHTEGPQLAAALERHIKAHEIDVWERQRATRLVPATEVGGLHAVELASGAALQARTVVLASGARWRQMDVPGEAEHRNHGVTYCPHCDGPLFKGKRVAVIGGGNSGVEAAIDLAGLAAHVTVIEFDDALRADAVLQRALDALPNTGVVLGARTTEVRGDGSKVLGLTYEERSSGLVREVEVDGIFVQIGLVPNTEWLEGTIDLSPRGEVVIDDRGATSVPGVFAAGDCTTVPFKQIVVAMGAGSTAALSAFDHLIRTRDAVAA
jgi:alkyl hydroperoxide reductase subunit F